MAETVRHESQTVRTLIMLRAVVAALGERATPPWWRTQFLTDAGLRAVGRIFPRTAIAAAVKSASLAAQAEHDRLIGVGRRVHLFRLPTSIEHEIAAGASETDVQSQISNVIHGATDGGIRYLADLAEGRSVAHTDGPVSLGDARRLSQLQTVAEIAAHYHAAFAGPARRYPYFELPEDRR
jgi:hypothetical protein